MKFSVGQMVVPLDSYQDGMIVQQFLYHDVRYSPYPWKVVAGPSSWEDNTCVIQTVYGDVTVRQHRFKLASPTTTLEDWM